MNMAKSKQKAKTQKQELTTPSLWGFNWLDVDRAFDNFRRDFERAFMTFPTITSPSFPSLPNTHTDIVDEGDNLVIKVDLPGVKKKDIELNVTDNSIEVSAEHEEEEEEKRKNFLRKERSELSYYRILPLPEKVVAGKAKAKLTDGILNITIPKAVPTPKPKKKSVSIQ